MFPVPGSPLVPSSYTTILLSVVLIGVGSSVFHPESSRVAFLASGGKRSFAQAIFQLGGNLGTAFAPLLVILLVFSKKVIDEQLIEEAHQERLIWFCSFSIFAMLTTQIGRASCRERV